MYVAFLVIEADKLRKGNGLAQVEPRSIMYVQAEEASKEEEADVDAVERWTFDVIERLPSPQRFTYKLIRWSVQYLQIRHRAQSREHTKALCGHVVKV